MKEIREREGAGDTLEINLGSAILARKCPNEAASDVRREAPLYCPNNTLPLLLTQLRYFTWRVQSRLHTNQQNFVKKLHVHCYFCTCVHQRL